MQLVERFRRAAAQRGLLASDASLDPATAFRLVRDMPYRRASDRRPETTIREWCGTCSGKHYLLQALYTELGIPTRVMAGTVALQLDPETLAPALAKTLEPVDYRFVDVHNYLVLTLPQGDMIVDATWPLPMGKWGMTVNPDFTLGVDQLLAYPLLQTWVVPENSDPQAFKRTLLREHFTPDELAARDAFIRKLSELLAAAGGDAV